MERLKYLDSFTLASADEEAGFVLSYPAKLEMQCYSDSAYPFKIFPQKKLRTLRLSRSPSCTAATAPANRRC